MLSAPQVDQAETYTLKQLNNVLNLAFYYIDVRTPYLFKTDPNEQLITEFKTELLPLLNNCSISVRGLAFHVSPLGASSSSSALVKSTEQLDTLSPVQVAHDFMTKFDTWKAGQDSFKLSELMAALVKQVFMKSNLLDYSVTDYQLKIDMRANAIREQFHQLVLKKIAKNLTFKPDGNTPKLFEENSFSAVYSERCFPVMIAELTQAEHFELAKALHNMLHLAKLCSKSDSDASMSTFQLAATYSPCFVSAFGLEGKIYTKLNGFTDDECARVGRQWKLMTIILTHTLESDCFNASYSHKKSSYQAMRIRPLLAKETRDLPAMIARSSHVTALELVIHHQFLSCSEPASPSSSSSSTSPDKKHVSSSSSGILSSFSRLAIMGKKKHSKKSKEAANPEKENSGIVSHTQPFPPPFGGVPTMYATNFPPGAPSLVEAASFFATKSRNISSPSNPSKDKKSQGIPTLSLEKLRESLPHPHKSDSARGASTDPELSPAIPSTELMAVKRATLRVNSDRGRANDDESSQTAETKGKAAQFK